MTTRLLTNIGELLTNDPSLGDGSAVGRLRDAALLVADGRVAWVGRASDAPAADERSGAHVSATGPPPGAGGGFCSRRARRRSMSRRFGAGGWMSKSSPKERADAGPSSNAPPPATTAVAVPAPKELPKEVLERALRVAERSSLGTGARVARFKIGWDLLASELPLPTAYILS